jgi:hypothetical protein
LLFVLLANGFYATSLAPVTWVLLFAIVCLWAAYLVLVFTFPILAKKLGTYGPFFSGICLLGFLFIRVRLPETKGQSLEELEETMIVKAVRGKKTKI